MKITEHLPNSSAHRRRFALYLSAGTDIAKQSSFNDMAVPGTKDSTGELSGEVKQPNESQIITVKTDVLDIKIDPVGGQIIYSALRKFPVSLGDQSPLVLKL